jgi:hypothetical protein
LKQEILKDIAGVISFTPYINNQPAIATSATLTIKRPGGETLVASTSASVNSTTGLISYSISAGNTATLGENYKADWVYIVSGSNYYQTTLFDIVRCKLSIPIIDQDLLDEQVDILTKNENFSGAVDSATSTTIVDADLKNYADDYWNGGTITAVNPAAGGATQVRNITDFVSSSGTVTVGVAWGTTPDSTYKFTVRRGFQKKICRAFEEVCYEIHSRGNRPALILESSELFIPMVKKSLALICKDYMKEPGDKWDILSQKYEAEYQNYMSKLVLQYDTDESGYISGSEKDKNMGNVRLRR